MLFCLFAEDTCIFEPNAFQGFVKDHTRQNGSDLGARLNELFQVLDTPSERRPRTLHEDLAAFPYVNGTLFSERLTIPSFTQRQRDALLQATEFQWARISPAVFGSLFQGVMDDNERRRQGAHYTSERDIMKVIRALFLDDLRADFERIKNDRSTRRRTNLEAFNRRLSLLTFFDPACGCGDFLVLAYREIRLLELEVLRELTEREAQSGAPLVLVDVHQFYGIEIAEWPVRIAEVAMWLMDHQMNQLVTETLGQTYVRLPLRKSPHILSDNALRMEWHTLLPPEQCSYILGNPPFVGKQFRTSDQQTDMDLIWGGVQGAGVLDYVTCWYRKAAQYIRETNTPVGFVSTNSITQGEQVGILWGDLFGRWELKIHFAHRTFKWQSEARGAAHVHVVIIGFGRESPPQKRLYDYDADENMTVAEVRNISPYLVAGNDVFVAKRTRPLCEVPEIAFGNMPNDGGHLLLSSTEHTALLTARHEVAPFIRPFLGSEEFINGLERWCIWLKDVPPQRIRAIPELVDRLEAVRQCRLQSTRLATRRLADVPALFGEIRQPERRYLAIPKTSSINRHYIPMAFLDPYVIASTELQMIEDATLWHFGILESNMHMAWVAIVCGRLKSDYRYSNQLVYNNFPWPSEVPDRQREAVERAAQAVLDARAPHLPPTGMSSLADLYDPLTMPPELVEAHAQLDRAVERCYRAEPFRTDRERVEFLFTFYERLTAPLVNAARRPRRSRENSAQA